jgi:predicted TPR repeat methyltransferase
MTSQDNIEPGEILNRAINLHQLGDLRRAEDYYRQVLRIDPRQFDALHLLGVIARQRGDHGTAIALITQALQVNSSQPNAHLNLGAALQDAGRTLDALASYGEAIRLNPDYAMAFNNRGNALRKIGRIEDALQSYTRALQIKPTYVEALCNLGIALQLSGRPMEALVSIDRALALQADHVDALCARGVTLHSLEHYEDAIDSYDQAIKLKPGFAEAWCNRGSALQKLQQYEAALQCHDRALEINPAYAKAHWYRGNVLRALGRADEAVQAWRNALHFGDQTLPAAQKVQLEYALAAIGASELPDAAPADYVKELFDLYADHFDEHLLEVLHYQTPRYLAEAIGRCKGEALLDTIELGCGTGLCGTWLRPWSRSLVGVDLSANMLDKARQRNLYDQLVRADLIDYLQDQQASCDLLAAADVFVYIGDLGPVFGRAMAAVRVGGMFCFSVEAGTDGISGNFALQASQRYAHSLTYIQRLAQEFGFAVIEAERRLARQDHGIDIYAWVVLLKRTSIATARPPMPPIQASLL